MDQIANALNDLEAILRKRLDPLGCVEAENGAYMTGHAPYIAPLAYHLRRYAGLDDEGIRRAEAECDRYIHQDYQAFLRRMNGVRLFDLSLHGTVGSLIDRSGVGIGQPISIWYQNVVERPDYIPAGHLGIGAINGAWYSQGHIYLASTGEVELYNAHCDLIGATWPSISDFLSSEITRQLSLYDAMGHFIAGEKHLPGDTDQWEDIAKAIKAGRTAGDGFLRKLAGIFKR
jgi:hypothetical protein